MLIQVKCDEYNTSRKTVLSFQMNSSKKTFLQYKTQYQNIILNILPEPGVSHVFLFNLLQWKFHK